MVHLSFVIIPGQVYIPSNMLLAQSPDTSISHYEMITKQLQRVRTQLLEVYCYSASPCGK